MKSSAEIVREFLESFMSGDTETAWILASDDFSFRASLRDGRGDKSAYFSGAREKAKHIGAFRILRQWEDGDEVSTIYEIDVRTAEGAATMTISEWHVVRHGQVASTFMVFDGNAEAVGLLRDALRSGI